MKRIEFAPQCSTFLRSLSRRDESEQNFPPQLSEAKDENWKIKIQSISNIFLLAQLNLYLFYALLSSEYPKSFPSFCVVLRWRTTTRGKGSSSQTKRRQSDEQEKKTNFMAFSWLYFLGEIVLFMSLRYIKVSSCCLVCLLRFSLSLSLHRFDIGK